MILYKYLPPSLINSVASREVRFTPPSEFNDPFECLPQVTPPSDETLRRQAISDDDYAMLASRAAAFFAEEGPKMILSEVSKAFGALCLSATSQDPLLWAHYANGHRGFALGFESSHAWFRQSPTPDPILDEIRDVRYQTERPFLPMIDHIDLQSMDSHVLARAMLFTKHSSWAYEAEWRLVRQLEHAARTLTTDHGQAIHLFTFPAEALREVIIGVRMDGESLADLRSALEVGGLNHVVIRRAQISQASYLLDIRGSA